MKILRVNLIDGLKFEYEYAAGVPGLQEAIAALDKVIRDGISDHVQINLPGFVEIIRASAIVSYGVLDYNSPESIADSIATRIVRETANKQIEEGVIAAKGKVGI